MISRKSSNRSNVHADRPRGRAILPFAAVLFFTLAAHSGEVTGTVTFSGTPPKLAPIETKADPYCEQMHQDAPLLGDEATIGPAGEFAWIFVWIANPPKGEYPVPAEPVTLDQLGCRYTSPVFGMRLGQTLQFTNSDKTTHNVRGFPRFNKIFNFGQPPGLAPRTRVFNQAEMPLKIKCDVHKWMKAFCFVMDHPFFAVTGLDGKFAIAGLPAGAYTLKAWHERLGELEQQVTVTDGAAVNARFVYKRLQKLSE